LTILGIGPAFWALVGGMVVSAVLERPALVAAWRSGSQAKAPAQVPPDRAPMPNRAGDLALAQICRA